MRDETAKEIIHTYESPDTNDGKKYLLFFSTYLFNREFSAVESSEEYQRSKLVPPKFCVTVYRECQTHTSGPRPFLTLPKRSKLVKESLLIEWLGYTRKQFCIQWIWRLRCGIVKSSADPSHRWTAVLNTLTRS